MSPTDPPLPDGVQETLDWIHAEPEPEPVRPRYSWERTDEEIQQQREDSDMAFEDFYDAVETRVPTEGEGRNPWFSLLEYNVREKAAEAVERLRTDPDLDPAHPNFKENLEDFYGNDVSADLYETAYASMRYYPKTAHELIRLNPELAVMEHSDEEDFDFANELLDEMEKDEDGNYDQDDMISIVAERAYRRMANAIYDAAESHRAGERKVVVGVKRGTLRLVGILDVMEWDGARGKFRIDAP